LKTWKKNPWCSEIWRFCILEFYNKLINRGGSGDNQ
jgi:hypothetical protein